MAEAMPYNSNVFLRKLKKQGNKYPLFGEHVIHLQEEGKSTGFSDEMLQKILQIVTESNLIVKKRIALLKCLIPVNYMPEDLIQDLIEWALSNINSLPVSFVKFMFTWINGLCEYEIVHKVHVSIYYECFFVNLVKENYIPLMSRLIYNLTKPENVTRRHVCKLLKTQAQYRVNSADWKKLNALLSLFKIYKPDCVPENIRALNIQSIWGELPKVLQDIFESVKARINESDHHCDVNIFSTNTNLQMFGNKKKEVLVPAISYLTYNTKYLDPDTVSIFDLDGVKDLGKLITRIALPCQAVSLMHNFAGHHLLAFSDRSYKNRFMYNLYTLLGKAFFLEEERFTDKERKDILVKTALFCQYIQEGIPAVNYFLHEYLSLRSCEYMTEVLELLTWGFDAPAELLENSLSFIKLAFDESSIQEKCDIFGMFSKLLYNMYVNKGYGQEVNNRSSLFLRLRENETIVTNVTLVTKVAEELAISGLLAHAFDAILLFKVLEFYNQLAILQFKSKIGVWTIPPPVVIYGAFTSGFTSILSGQCQLLSRHYDNLSFIKAKGLQEKHEKEVELLSFYINDVMDCLVNNKAINCKTDKNRRFLKKFPESIVQSLQGHFFDELLNVGNHIALLPYSLYSGVYNPSDAYNIPSGIIIAQNFCPAVSSLIHQIENRMEVDT